MKTRFLVLGTIGVAGILAAAPAYADELIGGEGGFGLLWIGPLLVLMYAIFLAVYSMGTGLVEAIILSRMLKLGYWRCFWYAAAANVLSTLTGMLLISALPDGLSLPVNITVFASLYIVTVAEETLVIQLFLRKRIEARATLKAVAAANAISYALIIVVALIAFPA